MSRPTALNKKIREHSTQGLYDEWRARPSEGKYENIAQDGYHCLCGMQIKHYCYIYNDITKKSAIVGNTCVRKFGRDVQERYDEIMSRVKEDKRLQKQTQKALFAIMPFGKYRGQTMEWVKENDPSYLMWVINTVRNKKTVLKYACLTMGVPIPQPVAPRQPQPVMANTDLYFDMPLTFD